MKHLVKRDPRYNDGYSLMPGVTVMQLLEEYGKLQEAAEAGHLQMLPISIGDEAWVVRMIGGVKRVAHGKISEMFYIKENGTMQLVVSIKHVARGVFGKTIFRTEREAVAVAESEEVSDNG